jgi:hypothetical protein
MLRNYRCLFHVGLLVLVLAGMWAGPGRAAVPQGLTAEQVAALEQRVRERWQALSASDYAKAWAYATPLYRSIFPEKMYALQFSYVVERKLTGVEVVNYDASAAVASVTARVMSTPLKQTSTASQAVGAVPVLLHEKWLFIDGEWWFGASG